MIGRETVTVRMAVQVRSANWLRFADHVTEEATPARQVADAATRVIIDSGRHELHERLAILSRTPSAAYCAPTTSRAASTTCCNTWSRACREKIATPAA